MKGTVLLKSKFKEPVKNTKKIFYEYTSNWAESFEDLEFILHCAKNSTIKIKPKGSGKAIEITANGEINGKDIGEAVGNPVNGDINDEVFKQPEAGQKKRRGRPKASAAANATRARSESTESSCSLDESSVKSRRAAAQAAGQKLAQVQSFMKATKLRRPTDFDKKQAKSRKTRQNQSAGSSSNSSEVECDQVESGNVAIDEQVADGHKVQVCEVALERLNSPTIKLYTENQGKSSDCSIEGDNCLVGNENVVDNEQVADGHGVQNCEVSLERLNTPTIKSLTQNRGKSKSLERTSRKRTSSDLFDNRPSIPLTTEPSDDKNPNPSAKSKQNKNCEMKGTLIGDVNVENKNEHRRKRFKSSTSSNDNQVEQEVVLVAHSSPVVCDSPLANEGFNGFDLEETNKPTVHNPLVKQEPDDVIIIESESQIVKTESETDDKKTAKSKKALRKLKNDLGINKENTNNVNAVIILSDELHESSDDSCSIRSRTRPLKKNDQAQVKDSVKDDKSNRGNKNRTITVVEQQNESPNIRSRTRVIKKADEGATEIKGDDGNNNAEDVFDDSPEVNLHSNTSINKTFDMNEEETNVKSRTRVIKKAAHTDSVEESNGKYLASESKEMLEDVDKKLNKLLPEVPKSPAPKGELVKKRVENFEKMKNREQVNEDKPSRVTRNAAKNKTASSATAESKVTRNVPFNKLLGSASKLQMTPGPESGSTFQVVNKYPHSTSHSTPAEKNKALVLKQSTEEAEKRKKEEERMKRQAKEDEAMKKKEKTLKATSEETRRKREKKLQKVVAAREAAEREKALLAAKLEKEKEDKMRLAVAEKEKQKEEHMRKKILMQQKTLEHEERRRQEEAARLAKIKEQEEEHRRLLAIKEREQELLQKQQKAAELRLAEAEKAKQQASSKLGKIAAVNNATKKMQLGMTPVEKANCVQGQSYEITPSREERPQLKSKTDNDYGLDDAHTDDSSDDESCPKKQIPKWALPENRQHLIKVTRFVPSAIWDQFMVSNLNPDLNKMFAGAVVKKRIRTSSAVWRTPPKYC